MKGTELYSLQIKAWKLAKYNVVFMGSRVEFPVLQILAACSIAKVCSLFVTPWTVAHQALLSMEFSRQEYCSGLPFPSPRGSSPSRDQTCISCVCCIGRQILYQTTREAFKISQNHVFQTSGNDSLGVMKSSQRVKTRAFLNNKIEWEILEYSHSNKDLLL